MTTQLSLVKEQKKKLYDLIICSSSSNIKKNLKVCKLFLLTIFSALLKKVMSERDVIS